MYFLLFKTVFNLNSGLGWFYVLERKPESGKEGPQREQYIDRTHHGSKKIHGHGKI